MCCLGLSQFPFQEQESFNFMAAVTIHSDCSHEIKKTLAPWKENYEKAIQHIKKQTYHFANKGPYSQSYGFSSSHVWMWELDYKESWMPKNWCLWTVVLEKTFESLLDCKGIKPVNAKGNQSWIFIGRTDAEAETPILWPTDMKNWLTGKKPWYLERLRAGEGGGWGWDGWVISPTQWTWFWANSGRWWRTGKPGMLQSMKTQRFGHDWATEQQHQQVTKLNV